MPMRRLDIGIVSYGKPEKVDQNLTALRRHCRTDYRVLVVENASPNQAAIRAVIDRHAAEEPRIIPRYRDANSGYAGGVNEVLGWSETEYTAFCDDDAIVHTEGWDETMAGYLDRFHEIGLIGPGGYGAYELKRDGYVEVLWTTGCFWLTTRLAMRDVQGFIAPEGQFFDETIGHQEEVDLSTRLRLKGYRIASASGVHVDHAATSTNSPATQERINRGVVLWVEKWERHWGGPRQGYHSPTVLRFELWPPTQLFMEEWFKQQLPGLNDNPEVVTISGREYDLLRLPRLHGYYRGRVI